MPFQIALSGLNAASTSLNTTANNISNVNTTGFKSSRANFVELFATGLQNVQESATGLGARTSSIQQLFSQGSLEFTDNNLDLALIGEGFFTLSDDQGALSYTRAGNFGVNADGEIVNDQGLKLQGFPALDNGSFNTGDPQDLALNTTNARPQATGNINLGLNLPSEAPIPKDPNFDISEPDSYNSTTAVTIFDSLGNAKSASYYFVKDSENSWTVYLAIDGTVVEDPANPGTELTAQLGFTNDGELETINGNNISSDGTEFSFIDPNAADPDNPVNGEGFPVPGSNDLFITADFANVTQFGGSFTVNNLTQDGFASGRLASIQITDEGVVSARFTNGVSQPLGQLAITNFANPEGLENVSDTRWAETADSGQALRGAAGTGNFGEIQSGAIETANVDLAKELVNMITAQRTYQANAQMITTADQITQTVLNIR
ncbi:flagellar hook protein FlgE [Wenzhouxiangella limi]|uniref:Flagellar hook protein FlgE n=1 Tax=Wenzhouxiangella limi TaxID=2707351 RepID=A0A845VAF0_9GAMM|nr:flagellar hook protein FlgE [Wenzhouxiangella limi]NDY97101.1 flagellar hook protein FlgE [Wenzhouxiangella limi]